jgi:hypothetical protein
MIYLSDAVIPSANGTPYKGASFMPPRFSYSPVQTGQLIKAIQLRTKQLFEDRVLISSGDIVGFLDSYPLPIIEQSLQVTAAWCARRPEKPDDNSVIAYCHGVMRKKDEAQQRAEEARKLAAKAEWDALSEKEKAQYPSFQDFLDLAGSL